MSMQIIHIALINYLSDFKHCVFLAGTTLKWFLELEVRMNNLFLYVSKQVYRNVRCAVAQHPRDVIRKSAISKPVSCHGYCLRVIFIRPSGRGGGGICITTWNFSRMSLCKCVFAYWYSNVVVIAQLDGDDAFVWTMRIILNLCRHASRRQSIWREIRICYNSHSPPPPPRDTFVTRRVAVSWATTEMQGDYREKCEILMSKPRGWITNNLWYSARFLKWFFENNRTESLVPSRRSTFPRNSTETHLAVG